MIGMWGSFALQMSASGYAMHITCHRARPGEWNFPALQYAGNKIDELSLYLAGCTAGSSSNGGGSGKQRRHRADAQADQGTHTSNRTSRTCTQSSLLTKGHCYCAAFLSAPVVYMPQ